MTQNFRRVLLATRKILKSILLPHRAGYRYLVFAIVRNSLNRWRRSRLRARLRKMPQVPARQAGVYHTLFPEEQVFLERPAGFTDSDWRALQTWNIAHLPESFVLELNHARVITEDGWVQTSAGDIVSDLWAEQYFPLPTMLVASHVAESPGRVLEGTSVCLAVPWLPNYYHWTLQAVPRFYLTSRAIDPGTVDHWIVPADLPPYVRQWLHLLEIPENKWVRALPGAIVCERLLAASIPAPNRWIPRWVVDFLRSKTWGRPPATVPLRRIYIARKDAEKRRILNRDEFYQVLKEHDVSIVELEGKSVQEQVDLFRQAELVIAPHGAALANIIYCPPRARVIEIMPRNLTYACFPKVAQAAGVNLSISLGLEPRVPGWFYTLDYSSDVVVDLRHIRSLLN